MALQPVNGKDPHMTKQIPEAKMEFVEENGDLVLCVEVDGKRIAKRYSGQNWISLEPGYTVRGSEPGASNDTVEIEYDPTKAAAQ
jgi:hypothetical protein